MNLVKLVLLFLVMLISCTPNNEKTFEEKILDFVLETCEDEYIEVPFLYDELAKKILDDKQESIILAESLKKRDFTITDWGRGNYHPRGPRIISLTLEHGDYECMVQKIYYSTASENVYEIAERIKCRKI